jgi:carbonic anhydrase
VASAGSDWVTRFIGWAMSLRAPAHYPARVTPSDAMSGHPFPRAAFEDVFDANEAYARRFTSSELTGWANKGLAVITCMDSRVDPLSVLGMAAGDVKILRNAGARVTEDVLRTLVLAAYLLGVSRVLVMPHSDCKMASSTEPDIHAYILTEFGVDTRSLEIRTVTDQAAALATDVIRVRTYPLLPKDLVVGGALFNVRTGRLEPMDI